MYEFEKECPGHKKGHDPKLGDITLFCDGRCRLTRVIRHSEIGSFAYYLDSDGDPVCSEPIPESLPIIDGIISCESPFVVLQP